MLVGGGTGHRLLRRRFGRLHCRASAALVGLGDAESHGLTLDRSDVFQQATQAVFLNHIGLIRRFEVGDAVPLRLFLEVAATGADLPVHRQVGEGGDEDRAFGDVRYLVQRQSACTLLKSWAPRLGLSSISSNCNSVSTASVNIDVAE